MKPIRTVVAGTDDDMLTELLERVMEDCLPIEVVARTAGAAEVVAVSRSHRADLVLLCERRAVPGGTVDRLREGLGPTAMVIVDRGGRTVSSLVNDPGIADLVRLVAAACGARRPPGGAPGESPPTLGG